MNFLLASQVFNIEHACLESINSVVPSLQPKIFTEELPIEMAEKDSEPAPVSETLQVQIEKLKKIFHYDFQAELKKIAKKREELMLIMNELPFDSKKEREIDQLRQRYPFLSSLVEDFCSYSMLTSGYIFEKTHIERLVSMRDALKDARVLQQKLALKLNVPCEKADAFFQNIFDVFQIMEKPVRFIWPLLSSLSSQGIYTILKQQFREMLEKPLDLWVYEEATQLMTTIKIIYDADARLDHPEVSKEEKEQFKKAFVDYNSCQDGKVQDAFIKIGAAFIKKFSFLEPICFPIRETVRGEIEKCALRTQEMWCKVMLYACEHSLDKVIALVKTKHSCHVFYKYFTRYDKQELLKKFCSDEELARLHQYIALKAPPKGATLTSVAHQSAL